MIDRRLFLGAGAAAVVAGCATSPRAPASLRAAVATALPSGFNGLVAVGQRGRVEALQVNGLADVEAAVPITAATRFKLGSGTKWLASAAVLRLVDAGRLSLDRPIGAWLPEVGRDAGAAVTLRHLLSNRSGIADRLSQGLKRDPGLRRARDSALGLIERLGVGALAHAPGTRWEYSAFNWVIVRALIDRVTGEAFEAAMGRLLFAPLRLTSAAFATDGGPDVPDLAAAYRTLSPPVRKMTPVPAFVGASGNAVMTAADAVRAAHGIFAGRLLSPTARAALTQIEVPEQDYALGGRVRLIGGERWAWETGKVEGYRALIAHQLGGDRTVVIFNNSDRSQDELAAIGEAIALA